MLAAQSYDSVKLLMILMTDIDSTIPAEIASRSKSLDSWVGVSGKFQSDKKGGVKRHFLQTSEFWRISCN